MAHPGEGQHRDVHPQQGQAQQNVSANDALNPNQKLFVQGLQEQGGFQGMSQEDFDGILNQFRDVFKDFRMF